MATDYFASAAYGVLVEQDDDVYERIMDLVTKAVVDLGGEADDTSIFSEALGSLGGSPEEDQILRAVGAPPDAWIMWTDSDDQHSGRSSTPPESFVIGYGVLSFPRQIPEATWKPEWHTWVCC